MAEMDSQNGLAYRLNWLERRVERIEELEPAVMADRLKTLAAEFSALKRALYTFAFSVLAGVIVFAFTAFSLFGHH